MPSLFQTFKTNRDPDTGKLVPVLNAKGEKIPHAKYRGKLQLADGSIKKVTLTRNKAESERLLFQMQDEQDKIRKGVIPLPDKFDKALRRPFSEVAAEYIAWGSTQGGRGGRAWAAKVTDSHRVHLEWWGRELGIVAMGDMIGMLPQAEKALRNMLESGKSGKTLNHYRNDFFAFCEWCRKPVSSFLRVLCCLCRTTQIECCTMIWSASAWNKETNGASWTFIRSVSPLTISC